MAKREKNGPMGPCNNRALRDFGAQVRDTDESDRGSEPTERSAACLCMLFCCSALALWGEKTARPKSSRYDHVIVTASQLFRREAQNRTITPASNIWQR